MKAPHMIRLGSRTIIVWRRKRHTPEQQYRCAAAIYFFTGEWPINPLSGDPHGHCTHAAGSSTWHPTQSLHRSLQRSSSHA